MNQLEAGQHLPVHLFQTRALWLEAGSSLQGFQFRNQLSVNRIGASVGTAESVESASLNETGTSEGLGVASAAPDNKPLVGRCVGFSVGALLLTVEGVGGGDESDDLPLLKPKRTVMKTAPMVAMHTKRKPTSNIIVLLLNFLISL